MRTYRVQHSTAYWYEEKATHSRNLCMLLPRPLSYQKVLSESLHVTPTPEPGQELRDGLGNRLFDFTVSTEHDYFEVALDLLVEIHDRTWWAGCESLAEAQAMRKDMRQAANLEAMAYLFSSHHVSWDEGLQELTRPLSSLRLGPHGCAQALMETIFAGWKFKAGVTGIHTTVTDLLVHREGVCQDFSHLMIAALRQLGIPARYVSGYLETLPKPGKPKLVGSSVSHAWVQAYDPIAGWKDFDPTNNLIPAERHITLSFGRDFADISPLRGLVSGGGKQTLKVSVEVAAIT